ncbi:LLM class flavin-dependent oxidoreductase [Streptomyces sp.]|uniref:LLM class flavin-dependent oxidoreductase n=1 Tax=Streptomyces sp. TaxID=1931 RepID=UPI002F41257F
MTPLSVLDLALVGPDGDPQQALHDVARAAVVADSCGYRRFWVAEHHNAPKTAGSSPAVLMAHLAARTRRIRVGSGGVMLTNHAPLVVAEQFAVLRSLYGDRIDLGVGRATGGKDATTLLDRALRRGPQARDEFPLMVDELHGFLHGDLAEEHPLRTLVLSPHVPVPPGMYILGVSENGARVAAERGLPFVYGHHLGRSKCRPAAVDRYRSVFTPDAPGSRPYVMASVNVLCADTDEQAGELAFEVAAQEVRRNHRETSRAPLPTIREHYLARRTLDEAMVVHGGPATVADALERLARELRADELMLVAYDHTGEGRCRTLRLLADHRAPAAGTGSSAPGMKYAASDR